MRSAAFWCDRGFHSIKLVLVLVIWRIWVVLSYKFTISTSHLVKKWVFFVSFGLILGKDGENFEIPTDGATDLYLDQSRPDAGARRLLMSSSPNIPGGGLCTCRCSDAQNAGEMIAAQRSSEPGSHALGLTRRPKSGCPQRVGHLGPVQNTMSCFKEDDPKAQAFKASKALKFHYKKISDLVLRHLLGPNTESLADTLAFAQHHDAVSRTSKQHMANDYAKRLSIGYTKAEKAVSASLAFLTEAATKTGQFLQYIG
ncbi:hypothetical protein TSUD_200290 [Trifolium subterraneum]|nr:hypothetical protein TSUD_200290 [Trifolium subterraneum]